jgi:exopolyphosphatase/guanosine-5'-triphosphate,3'-diphosphate pyrophosphatase
MSSFTPPDGSRCAVVDLGSNSVRLVVFQGEHRNPSVIFNEKAVLRLGRGLQATGMLGDEAVAQALTVMNRYHALARAMGVVAFEVLATAAVREAGNGPAFVAALRKMMPGVPIRVLPGEEEAALAAEGLLCGIPQAEGILADIGGGSLELVRLRGGHHDRAETLRLGVIRLAERAEGDLVRARAIAESDLGTVSWLNEGEGRDLYAVGGAFRALAHIHIAQTGYPLAIVHHYTIGREEARDLTGVITGAPRRSLEKMPGAPRRRIEDLPYAAIALRRVLRATGARRVVFSANGLREGWYMQRLPPEIRQQDPLLAACRDLAVRLARHPRLPPAMIDWTAPLFPNETGGELRMREAAAWLSDIGSLDHPDYRAEQTFLRVLRQPGIALDHHARAFLATTLAVRYDANLDAPFLAAARALLDAGSLHRAECLGVAFRLGYTLSGGTPDLLAVTRLERNGSQLSLQLTEGAGVFAGDSVTRRLDHLAQVFGLQPFLDFAA